MKRSAQRAARVTVTVVNDAYFDSEGISVVSAEDARVNRVKPMPVSNRVKPMLYAYTLCLPSAPKI